MTIRKKILLTDDHDLQRALKGSFFARAGFDLLVADGNRQALGIIEEQDPALAILDLDHPHLDGEECCRKIKKDPLFRSTPIILLARLDHRADVRRCREAGCDVVVGKPIDGRNLTDAACELLGLRLREEKRVGTRLSLRYGLEPGKLRQATTLDLSIGGVFVKTRTLYPVDTLLLLELSLPERSELLRCRARVAWVNHPEWVKASQLPVGMGLQFVGLSDAEKDDLRQAFEKKRASAESAPL